MEAIDPMFVAESALQCPSTTSSLGEASCVLVIAVCRNVHLVAGAKIERRDFGEQFALKFACGTLFRSKRFLILLNLVKESPIAVAIAHIKQQ